MFVVILNFVLCQRSSCLFQSWLYSQLGSVVNGGEGTFQVPFSDKSKKKTGTVIVVDPRSMFERGDIAQCLLLWLSIVNNDQSIVLHVWVLLC